ncbi:MAG: thiol reductant exporter subunit CydD [Actinomycetota bacterium]
MRPFDPRLAKDIRPVRGTIGLTAVLHFFATALLIAQSILAAHVITNAFIWQRDLAESLPLLLAALGAWVGRTILVSASDSTARYFGLRSVAVARAEALKKLLAAPAHRLPLAAGEISTLLTRGIEGLEIYVARYLPQLVISALVPAAMVFVVFLLDPLSALILVITLPLIPLFMVLVGWFTNDQVEKHWQRVLAVSGTIADLLNGLPELKVFGRARAQAEAIQKLGDAQKVATMKVLRLSFLSALVLELLATISVALIAVGIGLRLVNGEMELWRGLAALIIAPEVYAPLRMLGVHFHAASDGLEAWARIKSLLDVEPLKFGEEVLPDGPLAVEWDDLVVQVGDSELRIPAGSADSEFFAIAGPSGCGKTTLIECILGLRTPISGSIRIRSGEKQLDLKQIDIQRCHKRLGYVGQSAWLGEGTVRDVVTMNSPRTISDAEILELFSHLNLELPLSTPISDRSQGVSIGQRRRLAVARALLRQPDLVILDEPVAALDVATELAVAHTLKQYAELGRTVIVVAHRESFIKAADEVLDFKRVRV